MKTWYLNLQPRFMQIPAHTQVLNLVSDLQKARNLTTIEHTASTNHLWRALILLDFIIADPKWHAKLKELLRLRETIASVIVAEKPYAALSQLIEITAQLEPRAYRLLKGLDPLDR